MLRSRMGVTVSALELLHGVLFLQTLLHVSASATEGQSRMCARP